MASNLVLILPIVIMSLSAPAPRVIAPHLIWWSMRPAPPAAASVVRVDTRLAFANDMTCLSVAKDGVWTGSTRGVLHFSSSGRLSAEYQFPQGLQDSAVTAILRDPKGNVWVGTGRGLYRYVSGGFQFQPRLPWDASITALLWAQQRLWVGTNQGLYALEGLSGASERFLPGVPVNRLRADDRDQVWAMSADTLAMFAPSSRPPRLFKGERLPRPCLRDIVMAGDGHTLYLVATPRPEDPPDLSPGNLYKLNADHFEAVVSPSLAPHRVLRAVDREQRLWMSLSRPIQDRPSFQGLLVAAEDAESEASRLEFDRDDGLPSNEVREVQVLEDGVYVATSDGAARWDGRRWQTMRDPTGVHAERVDLLELRGSTMVAGMRDHGFVLGEPAPLNVFWQGRRYDREFHNVGSLALATPDTLYVGTWTETEAGFPGNGTVLRFHRGQWSRLEDPPDTSPGGLYPWSMAAGPEGHLAVHGRDAVFVWDGNSWQRYELPEEIRPERLGPKTRETQPLRAVAFTHKGEVAVCHNGRFSVWRDGSWDSKWLPGYDRGDPETRLMDMQTDASGQIWLLWSKRLLRIDRTGVITAFAAPPSVIEFVAFDAHRKGQFWVAARTAAGIEVGWLNRQGFQLTPVGTPLGAALRSTALQIDDGDRLWLGGTLGLLRLAR